MSEFRIKHIGIRTDSAEEAASMAGSLAALFDLSTRATDTAVWDDVEGAMEARRAKGVGFLEDTVKRNEEGKITFVYLDREIAGFQFHLTV